MESLLKDLYFGAKLLWRDKGFALTAILTLALCIAANTALFSVLHSVVLKPLPYEESDRILLMYNSYPNAGVVKAQTGAADYFDRLRDVTVFEEQAMYNSFGVTIGVEGSADRVQAMTVTPSFFRLLRVKPRLGRIFTDEEGEWGNERRVILSYGLCQQLYGGEESAVGKDLHIYGNPYRIVGVMPEGFVFMDPEVRLWRPLSFSKEQKEARHNNNWDMIGRLKPGATLEQAQAQIDALNQANLERFPEFKEILINARFRTHVVRLQDDMVNDVRAALYLLWGGAFFVMLIGAVNIANLVMARTSRRTKELATRFALGAGHGRVIRQLLTENVLLAACSAAIGLPLGYWGIEAMGLLAAGQIPRSAEIAVDGTVLAYALGMALAVGIAISSIPIAYAMKISMSAAFREDGRSGTGNRGARCARRALVASQIALALILLVGAGLLLASFRRVLAVNPGFVPEQVLTGSVTLPPARYQDTPQRRAFVDRALDGIRALPGVISAGATDTIPFGGDSNDSVILAEGYVMKPGESLISPYQIVVTPGYFDTMRIPLLAGRHFDGRDTEGTQRAIIIDERLARKFWPGSSPIGRRMWRPGSAQGLQRPDKDAEWFTVVGVVGNIKLLALVDPDERVGSYYFPYAQRTRSRVSVAVRSAVDRDSMMRAMRKAILELDPELPLYEIRSMQERIDTSLVIRRTPLWLALAFALCALFLAAVGIYGVLAYSVGQRTKEIGIRMALGSTSDEIFRLILREATGILAIGLALGFGGTFALAKTIQSTLYNTRPMEPGIVAAVLGLLAATTLAACILPTRRATRIDPMIALRQE